MEQKQDEDTPSFLVCVRVRLLTPREIGSGMRSIVRIKDNNVFLFTYIAYY